MENRAYPRINVSFPIKIDSDILGETINISETGLGAIFEKPILLSKINAEVVLSPKESIATEFKIIWNKRLIDRKGFKYGVCFIRLKERDLSILRDLWIHKIIEPVVNQISDNVIKNKAVDFFTSDCKKYMLRLNALTSKMQSSEISLDEAYKKSEKLTDDIVEKGHKLEKLLNDKILVKKIKETFRTILSPWGYKGKILKRAFEKPRGYPGDYLMIEAIYDNKVLSSGIGYCSDMYFLNNKYAIAVRKRKDFMRQKLVEFIMNSKKEPINILNIACGSCREITEMFSMDFLPILTASFTLVDHDEEALSFSKRALSIYKSNKWKFTFLNHNILNYLRDEQKYTKLLGEYSLIYSIGLTDYVPDKMLKHLISFWFKLLLPGGSLILAHKDRTKYEPISIDWWANWVFYPRDEKSFLNLIAQSSIYDFDLKVERENSGVIFFITITKN